MVGILLKILNVFGISGIFGQLALKKIGFAATAISVFIAASGVFLGVLSTLISSIAVVMPDSMTMAVSWFVPDNASACVSAYYSAMLARWVYGQKTKIIQYSLF